MVEKNEVGKGPYEYMICDVYLALDQKSAWWHKLIYCSLQGQQSCDCVMSSLYHT